MLEGHEEPCTCTICAVAVHASSPKPESVPEETAAEDYVHVAHDDIDLTKALELSMKFFEEGEARCYDIDKKYAWMDRRSICTRAAADL